LGGAAEVGPRAAGALRRRHSAWAVSRLIQAGYHAWMGVPLDQALSIARTHLAAGRLAEADVVARAIVAALPDEPQGHCLTAAVAFAWGDFAAAQQAAQIAVTLRPDLPEGWAQATLALQALGRLADAVETCRRLLAVDASTPAGWFKLGELLLRLGRPAEAADAYRQLLARHPQFSEAHFCLASALQSLERWEEALAEYRQALALKPDFEDALMNAAGALFVLGRPEEAAEMLTRAAQCHPGSSRAWSNLGVVLHHLDRVDEAVEAYRRAIAANPQYDNTYCNLGALLQHQGRLDEAAAAFRQAVALNPHNAAAYAKLGGTLFQAEKLDDAEAACRQAIALDPSDIDAWSNLGSTLKNQGRNAAAAEAYRQARDLLIGPQEMAPPAPVGESHRVPTKQLQLDDIESNLALAFLAQGRLDESLEAFDRARQANLQSRVAWSNYLVCLQYRAGLSAAELAAAHRQWEEHLGAPCRARWQPPAVSRDPQRPLRLGFVSGDLRRHPVGLFLLGIFEALSRRGADLTCYNTAVISDDATDRFRAAARRWRDVRGLSDEVLAQAIRDDGIDLLFDLAGHTADNRLPTFALKPAPLQLTWIGYEGSTGLAAMDYLLADGRLLPPELHRYCSERVLLMPETYVCYQAPGDAPDPGPLPALSAGQVTFGCFNNPAKITPQVVAAWADILRRVPAARLVLKYRGLDDPPTRERFQSLFATEGIGPQRIEFLGWTTRMDSLEQYRRIDLALDPFPFSGGLTTCEALWMGVPVLTLPGATFASRHGLSYLTTIGATEFVAADLEDYQRKAVALAGDLPRLAQWRGKLRQQIMASPLCDPEQFVDHLLPLLRSIWQQWCAVE